MRNVRVAASDDASSSSSSSSSRSDKLAALDISSEHGEVQVHGECTKTGLSCTNMLKCASSILQPSRISTVSGFLNISGVFSTGCPLSIASESAAPIFLSGIRVSSSLPGSPSLEGDSRALEVAAADGQVVLRNSAVDTLLITANFGAVTVDNVRIISPSGRLAVSTVSGGVLVKGSYAMEGSGIIHIETGSGDIVVRIPFDKENNRPFFSGVYTVSSVSGSFTRDDPGSFTRKDKGANVGGGRQGQYSATHEGPAGTMASCSSSANLETSK